MTAVFVTPSAHGPLQSATETDTIPPCTRHMSTSSINMMATPITNSQSSLALTESSMPTSSTLPS
eukprot:scaffold99873_cov33-Attheya_sp.AAC.1